MKPISLTLIAILVLLSCSKEKSYPEARMTIASEKRMAMGVAPVEVMLVKVGNDTDWTYFYDAIEGFNYEEGYEYAISVVKLDVANPPQDGSSIKYVLDKVISKEKKDSENLPERRAL